MLLVQVDQHKPKAHKRLFLLRNQADQGAEEGLVKRPEQELDGIPVVASAVRVGPRLLRLDGLKEDLQGALTSMMGDDAGHIGVVGRIWDVGDGVQSMILKMGLHISLKLHEVAAQLELFRKSSATFLRGVTLA